MLKIKTLLFQAALGCLLFSVSPSVIASPAVDVDQITGYSSAGNFSITNLNYTGVGESFTPSVTGGITKVDLVASIDPLVCASTYAQLLILDGSNHVIGTSNFITISSATPVITSFSFFSTIILRAGATYSFQVQPIGNSCSNAISSVLMDFSSLTLFNHYLFKTWMDPNACGSTVLSHSGTGCLTDNLSLSNIYGGTAQIQWRKSGGVVHTTVPVNTSTIVAGNNGAGAGLNQLNAAYGMCMNSAGDIFVADRSNHRVLKFAAGSTSFSNGQVVAGGNGPGSGPTQLHYPTGVALDVAGNLYVCDQYNHRVQYFLAGSTSASFGTTAAGVTGSYGTGINQLNTPNSIALDASGALYVSDWGNNRIQKVNLGLGATIAGGNGRGFAANQLDGPMGIALDPFGNLYVSDGNNNRVQKFAAGSTSATNATTIAGGNGKGNAANQLNNPTGIAVNANLYVWVSDWNNYRVQVFPTNSTSAINATTAAGDGTSGSALTQLRRPQGIVVNNLSTVYVSDQDNNRISVWGTASISNTYAPNNPGYFDAVVTYNNGCVLTSNMDTLKPLATPYISILPSSSNIACGTLVGFSSTTSNAGTAPTFQWYKNSVAIQGATINSYSSTGFHNNDTVTCRMVSNAGCLTTTSAKSGTVIMTVRGVCPTLQGGSYKMGEDESAFNLYPNPVKSILNVQIANEGDLRIVNEMGQTVVEQHVSSPQTQINIQHLAAGEYFYTFNTEENTFKGKVIKE